MLDDPITIDVVGKSDSSTSSRSRLRNVALELDLKLLSFLEL